MSQLEKSILELERKVVDLEQFNMIQQLKEIPIIQPEYKIATPNEIFELSLKNYSSTPIQFHLNKIDKL